MKNMTFKISIFVENNYCYSEGYQIKRGLPINVYLADIIENRGKEIIRLNDEYGNIFYSNDYNIVKMVDNMRKGVLESKCKNKLGQ